jgi:hypothetical protein
MDESINIVLWLFSSVGVRHVDRLVSYFCQQIEEFEGFPLQQMNAQPGLKFSVY